MDYPLEQNNRPTELNGLTFDGLKSRYSMSRSALFDRIKNLRDRGYPINLDKHPLYSAEDIATLDEFHSHMALKGASIANFSPYGNTSGLSCDSPTTTNISTSVLIELVTGIAHAISPPDDELAYLEQLERCHANGWLLKTSKLKRLIETTPTDGMQRNGFKFEKVGKQGRSMEWRVLKIAKP